jgi:hypothetical protein
MKHGKYRDGVSFQGLEKKVISPQIIVQRTKSILSIKNFPSLIKSRFLVARKRRNTLAGIEFEKKNKKKVEIIDEIASEESRRSSPTAKNAPLNLYVPSVSSEEGHSSSSSNSENFKSQLKQYTFYRKRRSSVPEFSEIEVSPLNVVNESKLTKINKNVKNDSESKYIKVIL